VRTAIIRYTALAIGLKPSAIQGEARLRERESCAPLQERERRHLQCARLRRAPRQRRSSPAGASTRSARASARTRSRFGHQDAQTPPSPFVGEGKTPPPVRAPPARTPAETLQPRRGFHALSEGFSPHPLSFRTSGRPNAPFSFCGRRENATSSARASGAHPDRDAPAPQGLPRAQRGLQPAPALVSGTRTPKRPLLLLWEKGKRHLRCARLRRASRQRRSSPAGASTRSARASARTRSRFGHQDAQTPPSPFVGEGKTPPPVRAPPARTPTETLQPRRGFHALSEGFSPHPLSFRAPGRPNAPFSFCGRRENATSGARASGAHPGRDAPAPQGLPRAQRGLQPAPALVSDIRTPKRPLLPLWEKGVGGMRGSRRRGQGDEGQQEKRGGGMRSSRRRGRGTRGNTAPFTPQP
jgi:hypothetical protein